MNRRALTSPGIAALMVAILASAMAQLLLKIGASLLPATIGFDMPGVWWIGGGLACYAISLLAWLQALARLPLSYAYPLLGISYVLVYLGAMALPMLAESFSPTRAIGILLVAAGVALVSTGTPVPPGAPTPLQPTPP